MTDFLKIAKSIVVHFAHICAYGVETVKEMIVTHLTLLSLGTPVSMKHQSDSASLVSYVEVLHWGSCVL